jgi:heterodisulfide reductase subunit A-like polyferredoxin
MSQTTLDTLNHGIAQVHAEGGGLLDVFLIPPCDGPELVAAALLGSASAARVLSVITDTAETIRRSARKTGPTLCLCCPRCVRRLDGVTFGFASPASDSATGAIGFAICERCSIKPDLDANVQGALRRIWPDLRPITVTHSDGGRA